MADEKQIKKLFKILFIAAAVLTLILFVVAIALLVAIHSVEACVGLMIGAVVCGAATGFCLGKYLLSSKNEDGKKG